MKRISLIITALFVSMMSAYTNLVDYDSSYENLEGSVFDLISAYYKTRAGNFGSVMSY